MSGLTGDLVNVSHADKENSVRKLVTVLVAIVAVTGAMMYVPAAAEAASVWACTPASQPSSGGGQPATLHIYNGSVVTANVATKLLTKTGTNLAGVQIPGQPGGTLYPGQTGPTTVAVPAGNTLLVQWNLPSTDGTLSGNVPSVVRVVSDQPIVVGIVNSFGVGLGMTCAPLD